jgi:hypothetical protein
VAATVVWSCCQWQLFVKHQKLPPLLVHHRRVHLHQCGCALVSNASTTYGHMTGWQGRGPISRPDRRQWVGPGVQSWPGWLRNRRPLQNSHCI